MAARRNEIDDQRSSEQIRSDIERRRREMDDTVQTLEAKLSVRTLSHRAMDYVRDEARRTRTYKTMELHPGIAALAAGCISSAAAAVTYLVAEGADDERLNRKLARRNIQELRRETAGGRLVEEEGAISEKVAGAKRKASGALHAAAEYVHDRAHRAGHLYGRARGRSRRLLREGSHAVDSARTGLTNAGRGLWRQVNDHPLAAGVAALAAGAVIGSVLPSTQTEDELMGRKRDSLMEAAGQRGKEVLSKAEETAEAASGAAADAAREEARKQGLSGGNPQWRP